MGSGRKRERPAVCIIEDCSSIHVAGGYCMKHYNMKRRYGRVEKLPPKTGMECSVKNCSKVSVTKKLCRMHYSRLSRGLDPKQDPIYEKNLLCTVDGCHRNRRTKGMCLSHYQTFLNLKKRGVLQNPEQYPDWQKINGRSTKKKA